METHHRSKILAVCVICTFALPGLVDALQFGSVAKNHYTVINPGERATFTILLWTVENETYPVTLSAKNVPENFRVMIVPNDFEVTTSPDGPTESLLIPGNSDPIQALVITVYIDVPLSAQKREYVIIIDALAGNPEHHLSVLQERAFPFIIDVQTQYNEENNNQNSFKELSNAMRYNTSGFVSGSGTENSGVLLIAIIIILFIAWRIYRHG